MSGYINDAPTLNGLDYTYPSLLKELKNAVAANAFVPPAASY